jgi:endonuclease YncB( thermonuclease family)
MAQKSNENFDFTVKVVGISDGDTFKGLTNSNAQIKFRIQGIDAPEMKQPYSQRSKQLLSDLIFDKTVKIRIKEIDHYGRIVAYVFTPDGKDVSAEMLKAGMAWHYKTYDTSEEYSKLEKTARDNKIGLWEVANPTAPWDYRKAKKAKK